MRTKFIFISSSFILISSCTFKQDAPEQDIETTQAISRIIPPKKVELYIEEYSPDSSVIKNTVIYPNLKMLPFKKDTNQFINYLLKYYAPEPMLHSDWFKEKILANTKVKLYGSTKLFSFIEYDYYESCSADFPSKYQFILNSKGKLIKRLDCLSYTFVKIFPNQNPFLVTVTSTSKGNGEHHVYRIKNDSLIDVYEGGLSGYYPKTYDCHHDESIYSPFELKLKIEDLNKDGYNDLIFYGNIIHNKNLEAVSYSKCNETVPIRLIFLYDKKSGKFLKKEDNSGL